MEVKRNFDFGGYATKHSLICSDGRVILKNAFKHQDGKKVPLVWHHLHKEPANILGHAILESRDDGIYAYCKFNETESGQRSKQLVRHGDITALSIHANELQERSKQVLHGMIREVSLVISPANPGALIDNLCFSHSEEIDETEAFIYTGLPLDLDLIEHSDSLNESKSDPPADETPKDVVEHSAYPENVTVQAVFDTLDDTQKNVVYAMIAQALGDGGEVEHSNQEGELSMKTNVFDQATQPDNKNTLTHAQFSAILDNADKLGSLSKAVLDHAATYGIENIDILFPEARTIRTLPDMIKRDDGWVRGFLTAIYKTPFSRIKSRAANLKEDEARAKGYITGNRKKEEVFAVLKRTTTPTTIYKKQKLDRDDKVDITDFDVVAWIKAEMRLMLDEELARAALIGDGRPVDDEDHINAQNIRPIWTDDELYAPKVLLDADISIQDTIDEIVRARKLYKGSGSPNYYTTEDTITDMLLIRDRNQRRIYNTVAELASALRVRELIAVEVMEDQTRTLPGTSEVVSLNGIMLNPRDYTMGADRGGEVTMFDDFDIDYNQMKYLIETRCSGALTLPKSAVVIEKKANG